jgi:L-amino acid N-acyltransferase YncA
VWVAEEAGEVLGFAETGPSRDAAEGTGIAELMAIYLAPRVVGTGLGRLLHDAAMADLQERHYREAMLWVLETNTLARRFYGLSGWQADGGVKADRMGDAQVRENRFRKALGGP